MNKYLTLEGNSSPDQQCRILFAYGKEFDRIIPEEMSHPEGTDIPVTSHQSNRTVGQWPGHLCSCALHAGTDHILPTYDSTRYA